MLIVAVIVGHGWGLGSGAFFDTHWHLGQYASPDWSLHTLLGGAVIKPDQFIDLWWQDHPIEWEYVRPVAVLLAKAVYQATGGSAAALHALSITLHLVNTLMVYWLCVRITRRVFWSVVGAMLFALHAHSVFTVGWIAAQNCVLHVTFMLAGLLAYVKASGLDLSCWTAGGMGDTGGGPAKDESSRVPSLEKAYFALALLLWGLALLSRETAIVLPIIFAAFDLAFGGRAYVRKRLPVYALFGIAAVAFAIWRTATYGQPIPGYYFRRYDGPWYVPWLIVKLLHYVVATIWFSPMFVGPTMRYDPLREVPGDCLLMLGVVVVLGAAYFIACRKARGFWVWPFWIVLCLLPVAPLVATPHSAYLPSVGLAVAVAVVPAWRCRLRAGTRKASIAGGIALLLLAISCVHLKAYWWEWDSIRAAETYTLERLADQPPTRATADVFFINLPFVNVYARNAALDLPPPAESALGRDDLRYHVLTFANDPLRMDQRSHVEQIDDYSLAVSIEGRPYFSGGMGRFLIEATRSGAVFAQGERCRRPVFSVKIEDADLDGVRRMVFRFREPLNSPRYAFYVATERFGMTHLKFRGRESSPAHTGGANASSGRDEAEIERLAARLEKGDAGAGAKLLGTAAAGDGRLTARVESLLRQVTNGVAEATASPIQTTLRRPTISTADWQRVARWWAHSVDDDTLVQAWVQRNEHAAQRELRDLLFEDRRLLSRFVTTDMYLTGPPCPGPRADCAAGHP